MVIRPAVEVKAIEGDALASDGDLSERRAHLGVEPVAVHAEVGRRIAQADEARRKLHGRPGGLSVRRGEGVGTETAPRAPCTRRARTRKRSGSRTVPHLDPPYGWGGETSGGKAGRVPSQPRKSGLSKSDASVLGGSSGSKPRRLVEYSDGPVHQLRRPVRVTLTRSLHLRGLGPHTMQATDVLPACCAARHDQTTPLLYTRCDCEAR